MQSNLLKTSQPIFKIFISIFLNTILSSSICYNLLFKIPSHCSPVNKTHCHTQRDRFHYFLIPIPSSSVESQYHHTTLDTNYGCS